MMHRETLPISTLPAWERLTNVELTGIKISSTENGRGSGIYATTDLSKESTILMTVPRELVLSLETIWGYAKADHHLHDVLEAVGEFGRTARGAILIFLLIQITSSASDVPTRIGNSNPWTEYAKYLPSEFFLPTFWNGSETRLLEGTSLEAALEGKLQSLDREFTHLRESTNSIEWCRYWWDQEVGRLTFDDWKLVDAMYRSRAMDLPGTGLALVPCMDMANHASGDDCCALYETDEEGNATLALLPGQSIKTGEEITISYGDDKGACEMLFSYGFLPDGMENAYSIFLDLAIPNDDPLKLAKRAAFDVAPGFRIYMYQGATTWLGPYVWLQCINEEDGLEFRVLQSNDGENELSVTWKGKTLRDILDLENCIKNDRSFTLFQLRAVTVLQQRIQDQLSKLHATRQEFRKSTENGSYERRPRIVEYASKLSALEDKLLDRAIKDFDDLQVHLYNTDAVKQFLDPEQFAEATITRVTDDYDDDSFDPRIHKGHSHNSEEINGLSGDDQINSDRTENDQDHQDQDHDDPDAEDFT